MHYSHVTSPPLLVSYVIPECRPIYWSLASVMGPHQVITQAKWYFIAPGTAVNQASNLYVTEIQNMFYGN